MQNYYFIIVLVHILNSKNYLLFRNKIKLKMDMSDTINIDIDSLESLLNETTKNESMILPKVRYGCTGTIEKDTEEYKKWRDRNNEAIKRCRNNKKELPKLKEKLKLVLEEEKNLIKKNILLLKEKEKLESIINEKGIYLNRLVTKEELDELKTLQKEYKELSSL
jgi:hypothetical protein